MTNFEKIKEMTIDEFCECFILGEAICDSIPSCNIDCKKCLRSYLESEAEE